MSFDLNAALVAEVEPHNEPIEVPMLDASGRRYLDKDGNPAVFIVLGQYSDKMREFDKRSLRRRAKALDKGDDPVEESIDAIQKRLATAIQGWRWAVNGEEVPFSYDMALVAVKHEWIANRVALAVASPADFSSEKSGN